MNISGDEWESKVLDFIARIGSSPFKYNKKIKDVR